MTEHRKHPRAPISIPMAFEIEGGPRVEARCADLSLGGMFIETERPASYGTALRIYARLPGCDAVIEAIVRWAKPTGMGVQFGRTGARETHGITELLAQR
ncbi:MAG: PilZ domain-containing protein [Byssovorax sp.]